jgi:hypothetical protein
VQGEPGGARTHVERIGVRPKALSAFTSWHLPARGPLSGCTEQHVANAKLLSDIPAVDMFAPESESGVASIFGLRHHRKPRHRCLTYLFSRHHAARVADGERGVENRRLDRPPQIDDGDAMAQQPLRLVGKRMLQPRHSSEFSSYDEGRDDLREALDIFGCAAAVRRVRTTLAELSARAGDRLVGAAYSALVAYHLGLRRAAADLASMATQLDPYGPAAARAASQHLIWAALLIDASPFGCDPHRRTSS